MRHAALVHAAAVLMLAAAFANGLWTIHGQQWPVGPDTFRDIAAAESIRQDDGRGISRGILLPDPYYKGEAFWYSPLMPALMAVAARISGATIHLVATRGAIVWNLAGAVAFYALMLVLFDPSVALPALAIFLYTQPFSSWQGATYSASLNANSFAQTFFYTGLAAWVVFRRTSRSAMAWIGGARCRVSFASCRCGDTRRHFHDGFGCCHWPNT